MLGAGGGGVRAKDMLGKLGEDLAAQHLVGAGFDIITRNWRCPPIGEADIIARDGRDLVLVEVKTRSSLKYGSPAEAITDAKLARLRQLVTIWAREHPEDRGDLRIDVVGVLKGRNGRFEIDHIRGVA
jgi:putative endonuclease